MTIIVEKNGKPITETQLQQFEQERMIQLPADYRTFLLTYNGGFVKPNFFDYRRDIYFLEGKWGRFPDGRLEMTYLGRLYSLGDDTYTSLERVYHYSQFQTPKGYFVFADDHSKNALCLSLNPDNYGAVYFCDTDDIGLDNKTMLYWVAPSFSQLLEMLHDRR